MNTPKIITIFNGSEKLTLPITPESFEITDTWNNEELNINSIGLITMIGKRGLKSVTISSFFPKHGYSFIVPGGTVPSHAEKEVKQVGKRSYEITGNNITVYDPWELVKKLQSWRGKILTLFISDTGECVSWPCVIDGDFPYGERDGTGDVYYSLTLKEYKKTNTKRTIAKPKQINKTAGLSSAVYTTKKGDTINKICRKLFGSTSKKKKLYTKNKKTIKKAFKKYMKGLSKAQKQKYKKKSKYNKPLPKGVRLTVMI